MGTGDYVCVTLRGGAPWGFTLCEGPGDTYKPLVIAQVEDGGRALLAGVQAGDEAVAVNGEPCGDLGLSAALALIAEATGHLQLLLKRHCAGPPEDDGSTESRDPCGGALATTTLHIPCTYRGIGEPGHKGRHFPAAGGTVELRVCVSERALGQASTGSARGVEAGLAGQVAPPLSGPARQPLGQRGVVLVAPSTGVTLCRASGAGRVLPSVGGGSQCEGEEEGGGGGPGSFTVSFGVPAGEEEEEEAAAPAPEWDSESEGDQDRPNKHRARHARLRRSDGLSEKQVKEAKSKCKRIALLLTAAPPHPNNRGVLLFKKHRQRSKRYTLVSYGTGESEQESGSDEEGEEALGDEETRAPELPPGQPAKGRRSPAADAQERSGALTLNWDRGLLELARSPRGRPEMDCLPETKGKGALMFAQRRQRVDEIAAEHEELRRQGIPVEAAPEAEQGPAAAANSSAAEGHAYVDASVQQQSQQQYQQYYQQQQQQQLYQQEQIFHHHQEQTYHHQHQQEQSYQQQQHYQQPYQCQQYEGGQYQQQQIYQQQQQQQHEYKVQEQQQQQVQCYSASVNGTAPHHTGASLANRTARPFSAECAPYGPAPGIAGQDHAGQGEQIASRDERIATPAGKSGLLTDARRRNAGKPMFTFKDAPKVSPNPALLNLLNRSDRRPGPEPAVEEDYLSLGAEACNFLQSQSVKRKTPPPVAPKPAINPNSPSWSPQIDTSSQDPAQNSACAPAVAPAPIAAPAPEPEPTPAPAPRPSPPPAPQEASASITTEEPTATHPDTELLQQPGPVTGQGGNRLAVCDPPPEPAAVAPWAAAPSQCRQPPGDSWNPGQVQPQSRSPPQPTWPPGQGTPTQAQSSHWTPQSQPSWGPTPEQAHPQPPWAQPPEQVQPHWAHPQQQQMQPPQWGQPPEPLPQQAQAPWAQPLEADAQRQPQWAPQQQVQPPWARPAEQQPQPPWAQQPAWQQAQAPGPQPQPPWAPSQQAPVDAWPQAQASAPWVQGAQAPPAAQPQANLNPWAPVPTQSQAQPPWAQQPQERGQHAVDSWRPEQNQAQQPPWAQPVPPQCAPQPNWQGSITKAPPQPSTNAAWPPAQTQPRAPLSDWPPEPQQSAVPTSMVNTLPSPKPWHPPANRAPPSPPQRMHSLTLSSPINPMATTLNPSAAGSAYEMPVVRGKGADMFAKRQSRMEKYVVDSETVQANKASRSSSPAASLPNEWKYTPNVRAPPSRAFNPIQSPSYPPAATKQPPAGSSPSKDKKKGKQAPARKPLNVVEVMKHQPYQLKSSLFTYGPAEEAAKPAVPDPKCAPAENPPFGFEQTGPVQPAAPFAVPYPQQAYGMPTHMAAHDAQCQQAPASVYAPPHSYQQAGGDAYQQAYPQHYQQTAPPPAYYPQPPQVPNPAYPQAAPQVPSPSAPYLQPHQQQQQQPPSNYGVAGYPAAAAGAAPKPKFTAKKSSAQVWKPTAVDVE